MGFETPNIDTLKNIYDAGVQDSSLGLPIHTSHRIWSLKEKTYLFFANRGAASDYPKSAKLSAMCIKK